VSLDRADALDGVRRHLTAFVDNVAFAEKLLRDGEPVALRWAVTAAFYAAPQHVEQALRKVADVESLVMGRLMKHAPSARDILAALRGTPPG
jgi:hypothetical protein